VDETAPRDESAGSVISAPALPAPSTDNPLRSVFTRALGFGLRPASSVPVALLVAACIPVAWLTGSPSFCPFKIFTGLPCPGCGITRSVVTLLHGDLAASLHFHPLGVPLVLLMAVLAVVDGGAWYRSRQPGQDPLPASWLPERIMVTPAPWVAVGALSVVWLIRLPLYVLGAWTF
jgi:hypothetical protein